MLQSQHKPRGLSHLTHTVWPLQCLKQLFNFECVFRYLQIGGFYVKCQIFQFSRKTGWTARIESTLVQWSLELGSSCPLLDTCFPVSLRAHHTLLSMSLCLNLVLLSCSHGLLRSWEHLHLLCSFYVVCSVARREDLVAFWDTRAPRGILYIMRCQQPTMKSWHHPMRRNFWKGQVLRFILSAFLIICCFIWQVAGYSARRVAEMGMIHWVWAQEPEYLCSTPSYAFW